MIISVRILIKNMNFGLILKTKKNRKMKTKFAVSESFEKKWIYLNYKTAALNNTGPSSKVPPIYLLGAHTHFSPFIAIWCSSSNFVEEGGSYHW